MLLFYLVMMLLEHLFNGGKSVLVHPVGVIANIIHHCKCSLEKVVLVMQISLINIALGILVGLAR